LNHEGSVGSFITIMSEVLLVTFNFPWVFYLFFFQVKDWQK